MNLDHRKPRFVSPNFFFGVPRGMMTGDLGLTWQTRGATRDTRHVPAIIGICCAHADMCSRMGAHEDSAAASSAHGGMWKL